jgi:hypothetical protein
MPISERVVIALQAVTKREGEDYDAFPSSTLLSGGVRRRLLLYAAKTCIFARPADY